MGDFVYRAKKPPIFIRSYGPYLEDAKGDVYFDAEAANGAALFGYDPHLLDEAVAKIRKMPSLPSFVESELRLTVAEKIGKWMYSLTRARGRVSFELGGAQAIELAAKIALKTTGKSQFVVFEGGYHGRSAYASQLSASHRYRKTVGDWRIPVVRLPLPDYEQSEFPGTKAEWIKWYLHEVDTLLSNEARGLIDRTRSFDIAALIVEPVLNVAGMIMPDKELFEGIVKRFKKVNALIIVDEIFTGFYRTGKPFGFCRYDIVPDMIVGSKGLTNGLAPLSFVWAANPLLDEDHFPPGTHSATFMNNVLGLAIADGVLDRFARWKSVEDDVRKLEKKLAATIARMCASSPVFKNGYMHGGLGRIVLKKPIAADVRKKALSLLPHMQNTAGKSKRANGILLASTGMAPDVINIHPPLNLTIGQIDELSELLMTLAHAYE